MLSCASWKTSNGNCTYVHFTRQDGEGDYLACNPTVFALSKHQWEAFVSVRVSGLGSMNEGKASVGPFLFMMGQECARGSYHQAADIQQHLAFL